MSDNLVGKNVYTESQTFLGVVLKLEERDGTAIGIIVKTPTKISNLFHRELSINNTQIVRVEDDKIIVKDNWEKIKISESVREVLGAPEEALTTNYSMEE